MKKISTAAWILLTGLAWVMPSSGMAREEASHQGIKTLNEKPEAADTLDAQPEKPMQQQDVKAQNKKPAMGMIQYKKPYDPSKHKFGMPRDLVPGATRGNPSGSPALYGYVLAPDHIGLTAQEQPSFYWYLLEPMDSRVEFTLIEERAIDPLLELRFNAPLKAGLQSVRLADYGIRLSPGKRYQWSVALVVDPGSRSEDIIAGGTIQRIEPPEAFPAKLAQVDKAEAPYVYAEAGLWYDALSAISELIDAAPGDPTLQEQRAALLEQVGLPQVVTYAVKTKK